MDKSKYLTIIEASEILNLKESRLRYEVFHRRIPYMKIGRSIRFDEKDLISWVLSQKQEPKAALNE
jgi:excisionase family DNA binding protein